MADKIKKEDLDNMSYGEKISLLKSLYDSGDFKDDSVFNSILKSIISDHESGNLSDNDFESGKEFISEMYNSFSNSDELKSLKENKETKEGIRNTLNLLSSVNDYFTSESQISRGQEESAQIQKPSTPRRYNIDPNITRSINESFRGISPTGIEAQINPAKQDIKDTFRAGQVANRVASAGNAGTFAALSQANVGRRHRAFRDLGSLRGQIRDSMMRNLNYALQNRLQEKRMQQSGDLNIYNREMDQYNLEHQAAGNLERAGRINKRKSLFNLGESLLPMLDNIVDDKSNITKMASYISNKLNFLNNNSSINDPSLVNQSTNLPSTNFDANNFDGRTIDEIFNTNLIVNPIRGQMIM